jgi:MATE family multidrug resistance protein
MTGSAFMAGTAVIFLSAPGLLARLYTADPAVLALAGALIPLAGVFQVFDGIQVTAIGVLRGLGDTRTPFLVNLMGYWAIGMPLGLLLAFRSGLGAVGLWWGLVAGLAAVALVLVARVRRTLAGPLSRTVIDTPLPEAEVGIHSVPLG